MKSHVGTSGEKMQKGCGKQEGMTHWLTQVWNLNYILYYVNSEMVGVSILPSTQT